MKIKSIEWWDDTVIGCTLTCSCGNEIEEVLENDDVIECNSCKRLWKYHVCHTFTPIKQMGIKSVEWIDDSVLGPCVLSCSCGNEIKKELVGDGDIITCDSCKQSWKYHQIITHSFKVQGELRSKGAKEQESQKLPNYPNYLLKQKR